LSGPIEPHHDRTPTPQGGSDRQFGLVFFGVFALVGLWSVWKLASPFWWAFAVATAFLVTAFVAPSLLSPLNRAWTAFGGLLHRVISPLILGLLYFGMFTPMGLVMRLMGKRPLQSQRGKTDSYWVHRLPPGPEPESLRNPF
jgi:predicted membrane metal-binding protein